MTEIASKHLCGSIPGEREGEITGTAAEVEHPCVPAIQHQPDAFDRSRSPVAVDVEGEQMIEKVIPGRDLCKHFAYVTGGLLFTCDPFGRGALHASAARVAARTSASAISDRIWTCPIRSGKTK